MMVSYMHDRTRGGFRVTVVMYRNLLSWRKGLHLGICSLGAKSAIISQRSIMKAYGDGEDVTATSCKARKASRR